MSQFRNLIKKIQDIFFGKEVEQIEQLEEMKESQTKSFGRIESDQRNGEPKIIHRYPKQGQFRFPVIDDNEPKTSNVPSPKQKIEPLHKSKRPLQQQEMKAIHKPSPKKTVEKSIPAKESAKEKVVPKSREKFLGNNFKPTSIPSPVYGFGKRSRTKEDDLQIDQPLNNSFEKKTFPTYIKSIETIENELLINQKQQMASSKEVSATIEQQVESSGSKLALEFDVVENVEMDNVEERNEDNDTVNSDDQQEEVVEIEGKVTSIDENAEIAAVSEEVSLMEAESVMSEEAAMIEPEPAVNEEAAMIEPEPAVNEEAAMIEPEPAVNEEAAMKAPDSVMSEEVAMITPDSVIDEDDSMLDVDPVTSEELYEEVEVEQREQYEVAEEEMDHQMEKVEGNNDAEDQPALPKERSNRVVIPFNVLMYTKDKEKQENSTVNETKQEIESSYEFPSITLLDVPPAQEGDSQEWLTEQRQLLENTLENFHVSAKVVNVTKGPAVTRFEVQPALGVKVSKITNLADDIKLSLSAKDIRIEAPIPGKNAIGIEVPNRVSSPVGIRQIIRSSEFQTSSSPLTVVMGLDISGKAIVTDIQKMPHGLIAGATGSGKSVCINSILISLMYKAKPEELKLLLIDPKMVELAPYNDIPHLVSPVITDAKQATIALKWVVEEMERRYELFAESGVRDIKRYNHIHCKDETIPPALPYIVVIIDELADLMMVSPQDVEEAICRIAQKARACGIHLLLATQRPSVDVITGLIKANIPTRIAFSVSSSVDSRTIIDSSGAERLLGKGDMLFLENGSGKPIRVQGNFVSDDEIDRVIYFVKKQGQPEYLFTKEQLVKTQASFEQEDDLFEEACYYVFEQDMASASSLQRRFRIGFNRAARLIEMMEHQGIVSEAMGSKPRNVLITREEFESQLETNHV
ncbi:DNA translocase FtsK [Anaerobacillus sp. MEB173]|uniref:DNA translocase FtsK n=1 Tax=Anaerobacillus sp. MEB173 TaxID=3383345 RepID=UPI003F906538